MPRLSERQQTINLLESILLAMETSPNLREMYHFIPELYQHILANRYMNTRNIVQKLAAWEPYFSSPHTTLSGESDLKLSKESYEHLLYEIQKHPIFERVSNCSVQAPLALQLQVFLFYVSKSGAMGSYQSISNRFGIGQGTITKYCSRVLQAILTLRHTYIRWPDSNERNQHARQVERDVGMDSIVGMIADMPIKLRYKPQVNAEQYNIGGSYYMASHIITDRVGRIRWASVGLPAGMDVGDQIRAMDVFNHASLYFARDEVVIGDAYICESHLISTYAPSVGLSDEEKRYNDVLRRALTRAWNTVRMLLGRFGRLGDGLSSTLKTEEERERVNNYVWACFIIHNMCLDKADKCNEMVLNLPAGNTDPSTGAGWLSNRGSYTSVNSVQAMNRRNELKCQVSVSRREQLT